MVDDDRRAFARGYFRSIKIKEMPGTASTSSHPNRNDHGDTKGAVNEVADLGTLNLNEEDDDFSDDSAPATPSSSKEIGTSLTVNQLWEGRSPTQQVIWLPEPPQPPSHPEDDDAESSPRHAITLLHRNLSRESGKQHLDTIIMRGTPLRTFLEATIPDIASNYSESEHGIAVRTPFRSLFWALSQISAAAKSHPDPRVKDATGLLRGVLKIEFRDLLRRRKEMLAAGEINFDIAWTLFKPGITCVTGYQGYRIAVKVTAIEYSRDGMGHFYYRVRYQTLGWDGEWLGWQDGYADVLEFGGRRKVEDLDIFPVGFVDGGEEVVKGLVERGRKYVELVVKEPYMMSFDGEVLDKEASPLWWQGQQRKKLSERLVLDARAYNHYFRRNYVSKWKNREAVKALLASSTHSHDLSIFLYCLPELFCFSLQRKKWARVWIDGLAEVVFNESAYPSLVLPNDYKDLLLAFAEAQIDGASEGFDDVIAGKGQGILMLLAGAPGTGKTLTAEAVAEHMKRPLYSVSAGELGASAGGMESELDRVLELSTRWNAVLLLDEADVFLERRTDNDIQRNSIVSVFLRKLEYYRGIMFLTTNRFASFDEAFRSRIHIAVRYPDLDATARRLVWSNFLRKAGDVYRQGVEVGEKEIDVLATKHLNGREIRNIVKSAQLLAARAKEPLRKKHLDVVWKVEHQDSVWRELDGDVEREGVGAKTADGGVRMANGVRVIQTMDPFGDEGT